MVSSPPLTVPRTIVLVGLMGAGKTSVGKRLAARLGLEFRDADHEIEAAAGLTVSEIFEKFGEEEFRKGERRVIARLLDEPVHVLATGGGAFMDPETRATIRQSGLSLWLKADLDTLVERTSRRNTRPLLRSGNPREILEKLIAVRYPVYGQADLVVESSPASLDTTVDKVLGALSSHLTAQTHMAG